MKKVIALVAFAAFLSVNTFAQETKVVSDKKTPAATEKASCCTKATKALSLIHISIHLVSVCLSQFLFQRHNLS